MNEKIGGKPDKQRALLYFRNAGFFPRAPATAVAHSRPAISDRAQAKKILRLINFPLCHGRFGTQGSYTM
ncbi:hypothetical protein [Janthinobacterium sp. RB2R34]|uniref:hypothetical protein n=1 Tax=Janthinobacterium sp. RB2R34 TaxID=3424193 RepID=UPI003F25EA65